MNYERVFRKPNMPFTSFFHVSRYSFPFGRPEGALKATLSLFERVNRRFSPCNNIDQFYAGEYRIEQYCAAHIVRSYRQYS